MIVLTLVVVIAVLAVTGVSLAVWISGDGEGASYDFEVMGWDDPSVRYLRFSAKGEGGEDLVLAFEDAAGCFVAKNGETEYVGAVSKVTAVGYYGIIEELLIPASIFVKADGGTVEGISVPAEAVDVVAVAMPNVQQDGGEALGLVSEVTIGANVASISAHSFSYMDALTKVTFEPSGVAVTLGDYCFSRCGNLTEIVDDDGRSVTRGTGCFE